MGKFKAMLLVLLVACGFAASLCAMATEDFGNTPLCDANYSDWPGILPALNVTGRVYHVWVNGNERFCYAGDTAAANELMRKLAEAKVKGCEVVLRPAPGVTSSLDQARSISFNWDVHLNGGLAKFLTTRDKGSGIWSPSPVLTIYVGGTIRLQELVIPPGVNVADVGSLSRRYRESLSSTDRTVRGWGAGELARLDPYDGQNVEAITKLLADDDVWVRSNAAGALAVFGKKAAPALPALKALLATQDQQLKVCVQQTIQTIEQAKDTSADEQREYQATRRAIEAFCKTLRHCRAASQALALLT